MAESGHSANWLCRLSANPEVSAALDDLVSTATCGSGTVRTSVLADLRLMTG
jgi:hypothetical protein